MRMKTMIPVDVRVIPDLEQGAAGMWTYAREWQNGIYGPIRDGDGDVVQSILWSVFGVDG